MNELPSGWTTASIRQLCTLENGRAFKPTEWTKHGLPIVRIQNLNRQGASFNHFAGEADDRYRLRGGELLFAWSGTPGTSFGAHVWRGGDAVLNQHIFRVDFDESIVEKRFFRHAINQKLGELIDVAHGGVGLRHVTKGVFENTEVLVPPLPEQKRIADKLDALLARVDACRGRLDRVPGILNRFRQSVLAAATSGELTREWREENPEAETVAALLERVPAPAGKNTGRAAGVELREGRCALSVGPSERFLPPGWLCVPLMRLAKLESGHTPSRSKPSYWDGDIPWIGIKDAREHHGKAIKKTFQTVSDEGLANSAARLLPARTVCLSRTASVGYVTIMGTSMATSQDFANWICTPALLPEYLMYALMAEGESLRNFGEGTTHTTIYFPELKALHIALPPIEEQAAVVRRLETLLDYADRLESRLAAAKQIAESLSPSTLAKAFRGELVPQNQDDEPASELFARLRTRPSSSATLASSSEAACEARVRRPGKSRTRSHGKASAQT